MGVTNNLICMLSNFENNFRDNIIKFVWRALLFLFVIRPGHVQHISPSEDIYLNFLPTSKLESLVNYC